MVSKVDLVFRRGIAALVAFGMTFSSVSYAKSVYGYGQIDSSSETEGYSLEDAYSRLEKASPSEIEAAQENEKADATVETEDQKEIQFDGGFKGGTETAKDGTNAGNDEEILYKNIYNGEGISKDSGNSIQVESISMPDSLTVEEGDSIEVELEVLPKNARITKVKFRSSFMDVISPGLRHGMSGGENYAYLKIQGGHPGTTVLSVSINDVSASCEITVTEGDMVKYKEGRVVTDPDVTGTISFNKHNGMIVYCDDDITEAIIPKVIDGVKVEGINDGAFSWKENLTSVRIERGVSKTGDFVFEGCSSLVYVSLPDTLEEVSWGMFSECGSLKTISIPEGIKNIADDAFSFCDNLKSVTIPSSITEIEEYAFEGCVSLEKVYFNGTEERWNDLVSSGAIAWDDDSGLANAEIIFGSSGNEKKVSEITLNRQELSLSFGSAATLKAGFEPEDADDKSVKWSSSNSGIVSVDDSGTVKANGIGVATVTAKAADGSGISASCEVTVTPKDISELNDSRLSSTSYTYSGSENEPSAIIKNGGEVLVLDNDFNISYENNVDAGIATAKVMGKGNYGGTSYLEFTINPKSILSETVESSLVEPAVPYIYNGKAKEPKVNIKDTSRDKPLVLGTDYIIVYADNTNAGTAKVIITGKKNYKDTKAFEFSINPMLGDVNGDGKITRVDSTLLSRYIAHWDGYDETNVDMDAADINYDGKITRVDSTRLSRYIAHWDGYEKYFEG